MIGISTQSANTYIYYLLALCGKQNKTKSKATGTPSVAFSVFATKTNGFPRKQKKIQ